MQQYRQKPKRGYIINIEEATLANENYRRVLFTTSNTQLVLMSIKPKGEIGMEVHSLDQFIRIEGGEGKVFLDGETFPLAEDHAVVVPAGTKHNIVNVGKEDLKLYTLYAPANHKDQLVERTKADEVEEQWDGFVSPGGESKVKSKNKKKTKSN